MKELTLILVYLLISNNVLATYTPNIDKYLDDLPEDKSSYQDLDDIYNKRYELPNRTNRGF